MSAKKPLRAVTCQVCERKFKPTRIDAKYCSDACRQRANRARRAGDPTDLEIEQARLRYWELIQRRTLARGVDVSQVVTEQAQTVTPDGDVQMGGLTVGHTSTERPGWSTWGLEAAGPPWSPPPLSPG